jgi:hypothetical protein
MKLGSHVLALLVLLPSAFAMAAEPPTTPLLRIETGMHTAMIKCAAALRVRQHEQRCVNLLQAVSPLDPANCLRSKRVTNIGPARHQTNFRKP